MKKIGILYHPLVGATREKARDLNRFLKSRGISAWLGSAWDTKRAKAKLNDTDLIITVGGDGTILRAMQAVTPEATLITGINFGKLGFMTELSAEESDEKLLQLLAGEGWIDERAMLEVEISSDGKKHTYFALNDIVVARGAIVRVIYTEATIGDQTLTTYKADGVIIATATGSTGYSLAAGGPILYPQSRDFIMVPIMPHLSLSYPLVLPCTSTVTLRIKAVHPATASIDGHINLTLHNGSIITVKQSSYSARFLRIHPKESYYSSLEKKLRGKHIDIAKS